MSQAAPTQASSASIPAASQGPESGSPRSKVVNPLGWVPLAMIVWLVVFGTYEIIERTLLTGQSEDLLHLLHILRGTVTSFLLAGLVAWYILRRERASVTPVAGGALRTIIAETEAKELSVQELWVIRLRWIAIGGVVVTTLLSRYVFRVLAGTSAIVLILIALVMAGYNALFIASQRRQKSVTGIAFAQVFLDLAALTLMLFFAGGIHNPFFLFYIFHIVIAGILLHRGETYLVTSVACALFSGMVLFQESGWVPRYPLILAGGQELRLANGWFQVSGILTAFIATACCTAYLTTTIVNKLRRRGQEILEASEILFQERSKTDSIVRSVGAGLLIVDIQDRIIWTNEIARSWFGSDLVGGDCCLRLWQKMVRCLNCPVSTDFTACAMPTCEQSALVNGKRRFFLSNRSPIQSADGAVEHILVLVQDITAMKEMQIQLVQAGKMAAVGQLAAGIAHEINNPLAVVASSAEILLEAEKARYLTPQASAEIFDRHLRKIDENVFRCKAIIHNLLGFARREEEDFEGFDLAEILEETVSLVEVSARARKRRIIRNYSSSNRASSLTPLERDGNGIAGATSQEAPSQRIPTRPFYLQQSRPRQVQQVFLNLLLNALDAVETGGEVTLSMEVKSDGVEVVVGDKGCGIASEHLNRIFEPFFTTKPVGKGTGLGLFISQQIVESLNGSISVESEVGKGTAFRVWLPFDSRLRSESMAKEKA